MRKTIAATGVAAALLFGATALTSAEGTALAQDEPVDTAAEQTVRYPHEEVLSELVEEGVITQEQADAVGQALAERMPFGRMGGRHDGGAKLETVAELLGIDAAELRDALQAGDSIADVAADQNVDVATVIEALTEAAEQRIDDALAEGRIDEARAEELRAAAAERVEAFVNGEAGPGRGFGHRGFGHRHGFGPAAGDDTGATAGDV